MSAESVDRALGMRATLVMLVAGVSVAAAPAQGAVVCDRDEVRVEITMAKPGPNDRVDASGRLPEFPKACRAQGWDASLEFRDDGKWLRLESRRLNRGELARGFQMFGTTPAGRERVRIRLRIKQKGHEVARSRSVLVDMTTFADLPSVE